MQTKKQPMRHRRKSDSLSTVLPGSCLERHLSYIILWQTSEIKERYYDLQGITAFLSPGVCLDSFLFENIPGQDPGCTKEKNEDLKMKECKCGNMKMWKCENERTVLKMEIDLQNK
jgi:hypothetical protein